MAFGNKNQTSSVRVSRSRRKANWRDMPTIDEGKQLLPVDDARYQKVNKNGRKQRNTKVSDATIPFFAAPAALFISLA